jgi:hypothetical protein
MGWVMGWVKSWVTGWVMGWVTERGVWLSLVAMLVTGWAAAVEMVTRPKAQLRADWVI